MSHPAQFEVIENGMGGYRIKRTIGVFLIVYNVVYWSFDFAGFAALLAAVASCLMVTGVPVIGTRDGISKVKVWGRPAWAQLLASFLYCGAFLIGMTYGAPPWLLLVTGGLSLWCAIAGGAWTFLSSYLEVRRQGRQPMTPETLALGRFNVSTFYRAGLVVNTHSGQRWAPEILGGGLDDRGRPYIDARVVAGRQTVADFDKAADNIASAWDVPHVAVTEPAPHIARITGMWDDGTIDIGEVPWQPAYGGDLERIKSVPIHQYAREIRAGVDAVTGEPWTLDLKEKNFLIGGQPGWGKSSLVNVVLAHLAMHPDARLAYLDFKDGAEAQLWAERADLIMSNQAEDPEDFDWDPDSEEAMTPALTFLAQARADMSRRARAMNAAGASNVWTSDNLTGAPLLGPDMPLKVLVIDECSALFATGSVKFSDEMERRVKLFVEKGRAYGYILMMSTQQPTVKSVPGAIRSKISERWAGRVDEIGMYAILGSSYVPESDALNPRRIQRRGMAVVEESEKGIHLYQTAWLSNTVKARIIAATKQYRRSWVDELPAPAPEAVAATEQAQTVHVITDATDAPSVDAPPQSTDEPGTGDRVADNGSQSSSRWRV